MKNESNTCTAESLGALSKRKWRTLQLCDGIELWVKIHRRKVYTVVSYSRLNLISTWANSKPFLLYSIKTLL